MQFSKSSTIIGISFFSLALIFLYLNNPEEKSIFALSCPLYAFTGLQCPGCGSQRAIHHFLHFRFLQAWHFNPLLISILPLIILGFYIDLKKPKAGFWFNLRNLLFSTKAVYILTTSVVLFTILRNIAH